MKRAGKILLCLASGVVCHVFARAADDALPDNPYALVVTRNVFGLNPPAPVVTAPAAPAEPPPKITPNGILSIFGHSQVLFKAAVAKPGQPAKDESYNLSEGQSEDDIEVIRIDEKNGLVTFNNHGTTQELPLIPGAASGGAPAASAGPVNMPGAIPMPGAMPNGGNPFGGGAPGVRNPNLGNGGNYPGVNAGPSFGGNSYGGNSGQPSQEAISPEAQVILIEKNRIETQDLVNQGKMPPLPPTPLTPDDATGNNGQPLVQLPPIPGR
jgi:hypothetical protein